MGRKTKTVVNAESAQPQDTVVEEQERKRQRIQDLDRERLALIEEMSMNNEHGVDSAQPGTSTPVDNNGISGLVENMFSVAHGVKRMAAGVERKYPQLPDFDENGDLEYFMRDYEKSTMEHEIPPHENLKRLSKALSGEAKTLVAGYLKTPSCLGKAVEELRNEYGPNESVNRVLAKCEKLPSIGPNMKNLRKLYIGTSLLEGLITTTDSHSLGKLAVEVIQRKLDDQSRLDWGRVKRPLFLFRLVCVRL